MVKTKPLAHCQFGLTRLTVPVSQPSKPRPPPSSPQVNGCPTHLCTDPCSGTAFQGWSLWHPVPCALVDTQASTADQGWSCPLTCLLAFFCVSHAVESRGRTGGRLGREQVSTNQTKRNRTEQERATLPHAPVPLPAHRARVHVSPCRCSTVMAPPSAIPSARQGPRAR